MIKHRIFRYWKEEEDEEEEEEEDNDKEEDDREEEEEDLPDCAVSCSENEIWSDQTASTHQVISSVWGVSCNNNNVFHSLKSVK